MFRVLQSWLYDMHMGVSGCQSEKRSKRVRCYLPLQVVVNICLYMWLNVLLINLLKILFILVKHLWQHILWSNGRGKKLRSSWSSYSFFLFVIVKSIFFFYNVVSTEYSGDIGFSQVIICGVGVLILLIGASCAVVVGR